MRAIDIGETATTLHELLSLAGEANLILRTPEGRIFVLAEIDDFAEEVAQVTQNGPLMQLLTERSKEIGRFSLGQVREQLQAKKRPHRTKNVKGNKSTRK
jgi:hypothetical protein